MIENFKELDLQENLIEALKIEGIQKPTEIQSLVIPRLRTKNDLIAQAETGSGKTLAYLLPLFERLSEIPEQQAMILVPTHELAIQVNSQIDRLRKNSGIELRGASLIGNASIERQIERLKEKPQIIVGSPGRILELIRRKKVKAHTIKTIVIDEADKLLDRNNIDQVRAVVKCTLKERQIALFSASISQQTIAKAREFMKEPELVHASETLAVPETIRHIYILAEKRDKLEVLRKLTHILHPQKAIAFINKPEEIELAAEKLSFHKLRVAYLHGTESQRERKGAMARFRSGKAQILVASDMAARGLDFPEIDVIFNLAFPENSTDYLHRSGRTGRGGRSGLVVSIVTFSELELLQRFGRELKLELTEKCMYQGKLYDVRAERK